MSNDELQRAIDDITMSDAGMSAPVTPAMENSENNQLADEIANALAEGDFETVDPAPIMSGEMMQTSETQAPEMPEVKEMEAPQMPDVAAEPEMGLAEEPVAEDLAAVETPVVEPEIAPEVESVAVPEVAVTPQPEAEAIPEPEVVSEPVEEMPDVEAPVPEPEVEVPVEKPEVVEDVSVPDVAEEKVETKLAGDLEEVKKNALKELYPLLKKMNINAEQAYGICKEVAEMGEKEALNEAFEHAKKIANPAKRAEALFDIVKMIEKDE